MFAHTLRSIIVIDLFTLQHSFFFRDTHLYISKFTNTYKALCRLVYLLRSTPLFADICGVLYLYHYTHTYYCHLLLMVCVFWMWIYIDVYLPETPEFQFTDFCQIRIFPTDKAFYRRQQKVVIGFEFGWLLIMFG